MENSPYRRDPGLDPTYRPAATGTAFLKRISWSAVFAGVLIAVVTQLVLSLLGIGIGLSTVDVQEEANPTAGLGTGSIIWLLLTTLIGLFIGGWVAGRLSSAPRRFDGAIHGVLTWSLVTLLTFYLLSTAVGRIIGGVTRVVGGVLSTAGSGIAAAAPELADAAQSQLNQSGIDLTDLRSEINQVLRETGKPGLQPEALENRAERAADQAQSAAGRAAQNPQAADQTADNIINQLFRQGQSVATQVDRDAAVNVVMSRTGKSRAEATQIVDNWVNTYQQARSQVSQTAQQATEQAKVAADNAADAASSGAIWGALGLLVGAAVAGFGAMKGADSKDDYNRYDRPVDA